MAPLKPRLKALSAPPEHGRRLGAASTAQLKSRRQAKVVRWKEDISPKRETVIEDVEDISSDSDATMAGSDPIESLDSDRSFTTMSSDISSDSIVEEPPRQPMSDIIVGMPVRGEDPEWDAFIEDEDSDTDVEDVLASLDSSDVESFHSGDA
ncbi:hypothetical protein K438DRAFT_1779504 [Mycena galopus ATCC 62051]|nr:hypothetical protein K438DRAFT_2001165 [Mycena galopus ATCC 62051]KAF8149014.1 hypothetical protein K438DRAFT_1779504 [Mycena galopus ATCC 62051]